MSKKNQQTGKVGEDLARSALHRVGVNMVERIGTPIKAVPVNPKLTAQSIFRVIWGEKVSGDFRGVAKGGISVLAEVKTVFDRNLRWSDFSDHQPIKLQEHCDLGGISLIVWVHRTGIHVMRYPIEGFQAGVSIDPVWAEKIEIFSL